MNPEDRLTRHGDILFRFAMARVRDPETAEDLVQETFLAALKGARNFSGGSSERTWLVGILKHKIADHFRRASRETPVADPEPLMTGEECFDARGRWKTSPGEWGRSPAGVLQDKEFWRTFSRCVEALPDRLRQAFTLKEVDGMGTDVLCKVLRVSPTNLWVMLHRARARLRRCLEVNWFEGEKD